MHDTFTNIFPSYVHGEQTVFKNKYVKTTMNRDYAYPETSFDGSPTHVVDRSYTNKLDQLKIYTEEMLKLSSMRR